jgi:hypothetical protein
MNTPVTAGKIYTELKSRIQDRPDIVEFTKALGDDLMPKLVALIENDKHKTNNDFYVEVCIRMNALMPGVPEFYMLSRESCPTPFPDRAVFHYDRKKDAIFFLWHVPSLLECDYYRNNMLTLRPDEHEAARDALAFMDGRLLQRAKVLNHEINDYELTFFRKDMNGNGNPITS